MSRHRSSVVRSVIFLPRHSCHIGTSMRLVSRPLLPMAVANVGTGLARIKEEEWGPAAVSKGPEKRGKQRGTFLAERGSSGACTKKEVEWGQAAVS